MVREMLFARRMAEGISRRAAAKEIGVTETNLRHWEAGVRPQDRYWPKLSAWLGITVDEIRASYQAERAA